MTRIPTHNFSDDYLLIGDRRMDLHKIDALSLQRLNRLREWFWPQLNGFERNDVLKFLRLARLGANVRAPSLTWIEKTYRDVRTRTGVDKKKEMDEVIR